MELSDLSTLRNRTRERVMSHSLISRVHRRRLEKEQYAGYLSDVYHYAKHSSQVIASAGVRLVSSNRPLAEYLFQHATEEVGHDEWAKSDLRDLGWCESQIEASPPSEMCERMIALEYFYACHSNPVGLFGWMYVLECLGGDIGGGLARAVDEALGLQGRGTYFLRGHGEADADHSMALFDVIGRHVHDPADCEAVRRVAALSLSCYLGILDSAENATAEAYQLTA